MDSGIGRIRYSKINPYSIVLNNCKRHVGKWMYKKDTSAKG